MAKSTNMHLFVGLACWLAYRKTSGFDSRKPETSQLLLMLWCGLLLSRDTSFA